MLFKTKNVNRENKTLGLFKQTNKTVLFLSMVFVKLDMFCETHPPVRQISHMERFCGQALSVTPPGQRSTDTPVRQK